MKFSQCYTNITKVTVHYNMPTSQMKCYNVTVLQPIHWLKNRKNISTTIRVGSKTTISYFVVL